MDAKERRKQEKKEKRDAQKQEMQYYRDQLLKLANGTDARGQIAFPPTLQKGQRKKLHNYAASLDLKSKSHGKGDNRFLMVYKKNVIPYVPTGDGSANYLRLTNTTIDKLLELTNHDPVSDAEKEITIVRSNDTTKSHAHLPFMFGDARSKAKLIVPPMTNGADEYRATRQSLPIFEYRDEIIEAIQQNQVVVISGETGSGKTTQVPQYIMEDSSLRGQECRIICTQPRRLAATSIATRVSTERNDSIGRSVGYQIRLDSRISANTNLIFTTSGFLLRCLTGSKQDEVYRSITHLILDEVHEREKVTDFLLIAIRDAIKTNPHLKVILMSATLDSEQFSRYFENCPVINVPGRMFDVEIMHLGDVLVSTGYKTKEMTKYMSDNPLPKILRTSQNMASIAESHKENEQGKVHISDEDIKFYDECLDECMTQDDDDASFEQIFCLITDENMPVDYMHSTKSRTALGIAAEKGFLNVLTKLLSFGANPTFKDAHGKCALDYAEENEQEECSELLAYYENVAPITAATIAENDTDAENKAWLQFTQLAYQINHMKREGIDHDLLNHVIYHIHTEKSTDGSILVFLPGYEDIMDQKEKIENRLSNMQNYQLFVLHSGVNGTSNAEQSRVFDRMPKGIRKIILSTNIAETSLTINDVVYVVDAGKVKQLSYDSISESTCLTSTNISQACAKQRAGRAGRIQCGFCYRLYPLEQYETMEKYTLPEILRVPLTEICLNTKMLAGDLSIEEFLLKALQPPSATNIRQSIELLKKINALDANENITYLGIHLANMPVDCQLGKMILYAIVLRCLDPVVTIVSALSVKDPFMLPLGNEGEKINQIKKEFARNSLSDHQMLLNTFDEWSKKKTRHQYEFCHENFISQGNMHMIQGVRRLIMGHLTMAGFVCENTARNIRKLNENSLRWDVVKACLTAGLYPNVCRISPIVGQLISKQDKKIIPHLSSVLRERKGRFQLNRTVKSSGAEWMIHGEKSRIANNSFVRNITIVPAINVALFTGPIILSDSCLVSTGGRTVEVSSDMDCDDIPLEDDIDNTDLDDQLFGCGGEDESETIFNIDDWISFIVDDTEATLLLQLRQKFASMFVKFLRNPIDFQMTNKEQATLKVLLDVLQEEDDIEKYLKEHPAKTNTEDDNVESECVGSMNQGTNHSEPANNKNDRKPIPERAAGPAFNSPAYNQAIEPEGRRNKKKNKKKNKHDQKKQQSEPNRKLCMPDVQNQMLQASTSNESHSSFTGNPQQKLTQGLFNQLNQPFSLPELQLPQNLDACNISAAPMNYFVQNRYFILVVKHVGAIYESVYNNKWQFRTPLSFIRAQARESAPGKIILFWYIEKKRSIFGYGEFQARGQGNYHINIDANIRNFRPLLPFDADDDHELSTEQGNEVYSICMSIANLKRP